MKKRKSARKNGLRPEYDFAAMKGGVRGKYARRTQGASTLVVLEPEVARAFPTERAVNEALRGILNAAQAVRRAGGLGDKSLRPAASGRQRPRR